ncbi:MAG: glycosyltransferase family 39 protein [Anaerolineae bacterium]|jgi:4-amino-4-deoxy-L-arabinose transferase-like glycosyltransferase
MMAGNGTKRERVGWMGRSGAFAALAVLFVGLALLYNLTVPPYESPDELQHMAFVVWLADGQGLPVVDPEDPGPWQQEGTQPPLYYWIVAQLTRWLPHPKAGELAELNPYAGIGDPQRPDNKNRVVHDARAGGWPFRQEVLFVHLGRLISTLMALGTLAATYALGRAAFPQRPGIVLAAVGLVAFVPQFLFLSASVNNDNLVILIATWVLVVLARWLRGNRRPGWLSLAGLGLLLGLATLAKFSGTVLWPLAAGVLLWLAWREKRWGWLFAAGLVIFGLAAAVSGWWFVRNLQLYGDVSALAPHLEIMGIRRRVPTWPQAVREFRGFRYSFWALFGWFNILAPEPFYWLMDGLTLLALAGLAIFSYRSLRRQPAATRRILALIVVWLGLVLLGLVRWTGLTPASQGRLVYPALAPVALLLVIGWAQWLPQRLKRPLGLAGLLGWGVWAVVCAVLIIRPAYALPERVSSLRALDEAPSPVEVGYAGCCQLLGSNSPQGPVKPGEWLPLRLVWRAQEEMDEDLTLFVHATMVDGSIAGQVDTYHGGGMYPTSQWQPGEIIDDVAYVPVSWRAEGPALLRLSIGLRGQDVARLPATAQDGQPLEVVFAGEAMLVPFEWPELVPDPAVETVFAEKIRLVTATRPEGAVQPGQAVTVTLQWEALDRIEEDYTGFVHLVAPGRGDVAQDDHQPRRGGAPTRLWFPGMVVSDPYRLPLQETLAVGTYELWAGFYRPGTGQRLPAIHSATGEQWQDDLVYLGDLVVSEDG